MRETWACCMRFSQAAVATANADPGCAKRLPYVAKLAESMKPLLPHSKDHQLELPPEEIREHTETRSSSRPYDSPGPSDWAQTSHAAAQA